MRGKNNKTVYKGVNLPVETASGVNKVIGEMMQVSGKAHTFQEVCNELLVEGLKSKENVIERIAGKKENAVQNNIGVESAVI